MPRFLRILLISAGLLAALLYAAYLAVGNWLLRGELERRLDRRPEALTVRWRSAWTAWPGVVYVEGFEIRGQTRAVQWWAAVDRGRIDLDIGSLPRRVFAAHGIEGEGVSFRLRRRRDARPPWSTDPALAPPIPGLANPPLKPPERLYPPRPRPAGARHWRIELADLDLRQVREVWIEELRLRGEARAVGGFDLTLRERLEVLPSRIEIARGDLLRGGRPVLTGVSGEVTAALTPFDPLRWRGRQAFRFAGGRVRVEGNVGGLGALESLLAPAEWIAVAGGAGPLAADVRLGRGHLLPGSRIEARPRQVRVAFLDYEARGSGRVVWEVLPGAGGHRPTGRLTTRLAEYDIRRHGYPRPHVRGRDLAITTLTPEPVFERLFFPVALAIDLPAAEVPDLSFYNAYLPAGAGLAVRSGRGTLSGSFRAASPDWVGSGRLTLRGRGVAADFRNAHFRGDFALRTHLARADLKERTFDLSGSDFELTGVAVEDGDEPGRVPPGWWARGHLDRGRLLPGRPVFLTAAVEAMMRDPRPLVALFAPEGRPQGRAIRWIEDAVDVQGVGVTAEVKLGDDRIEIDKLAAVGLGAGGRELELKARLRIRRGVSQGALYARFGRLDLGLELDGGKRDWKILHPRRWFEAASGDERTGRETEKRGPRAAGP